MKKLIDKVPGIGKNITQNVEAFCGINNRSGYKFIKQKQRSEISRTVDKLLTGKKLKESEKEVIDFLSKIRAYRGVRHKLKYPARGQRTHTNAKTKKKFRF